MRADPPRHVAIGEQGPRDAFGGCFMIDRLMSRVRIQTKVIVLLLPFVISISAVGLTGFYASYVCPACGFESSQLVDAVAQATVLRQMQVPKLPCPECRAEMELGDYPERYLSIFRERPGGDEPHD